MSSGFLRLKQPVFIPYKLQESVYICTPFNSEKGVYKYAFAKADSITA